MKFSPQSRIILVLFGIALSAIVFMQPFALDAEETAEPFPDIVKRAEAQNRPILLEFTGSDWCPPCKAMAKTVFETSQFEKFAKENLVFVKLDFPKRRKQSADVKRRNEELAQKFNVQAFPTVILLDSKGNELDRSVGFIGGGASAFIDWVKAKAALK
jgi:thiol-disulfide isomerase/thioredoxin